METYSYTAYGLNFSSAIRLPELRQNSNAKPDIHIKFGKTPESLPFPSPNGLAWQSAPGQTLLTIDNVARYLVNHNDEIIIEPEPSTKESDIRVYLLGSVLGVILHAKEILVLHSSVIQTKKGAVLFMGKSRAGKSTLLGTFLKRGYSMLADDKAGIIVDENGVAQALSAFPMARITKETVNSINFPADEKYYNPDLRKYFFPVESFCREPQKIYAAYSINANNQAEIKLAKLESFELFEILTRHIYRRRFVNLPEVKKVNFNTLGVLAKQAKITKVIRPDDVSRIEELANIIEEDFNV